MSNQDNDKSQFNESVIIAQLIDTLEKKIALDKVCCDVGALDGRLYSNTFNLITQRGYKGVLIEPAKERYEKLCKNFPEPNHIKINTFVDVVGENKLDHILSRHKIPYNFDFLNIDIDGCDYYIFQSMKSYKPKIICIEYNFSIPNEVEYVQRLDFSVKRGSSAKSIVKLANARGYKLAAITQSNLIFISDPYAQMLDINYDLDDLRDDSESKIFLFFGYDGTLLSNKTSIKLYWHDDLNINLKKLQVIPQFIRKFPEDYGLFKKYIYICWLATKNLRTTKDKMLRVLMSNLRK